MAAGGRIDRSPPAPIDVQRSDQRGEGSPVLDPRWLQGEIRQIKLRDHDDWMVGLMPGNHHRGVAIRLMHRRSAGRSEAAQIEDVGSEIRHQAIQPAPLQRLQEPLEVAEPSREGSGA